MSDLFEPLRTPTAHPPLPPEEVRRRGDRFRRRRQALQAGAAACAVALVATGAFLVGGDGDPTRSVPPVATQGADPTPTTNAPVTRIPDGFPLAQGLEEYARPGGDERLVGPSRRLRFVADLVICDADYSPADLATDRLTVKATGIESFVGRDLSVYPDEATAAAAAQNMVAKYDACPRFTRDGGASYALNDVQRWDSRPAAWSVARSYETDGVPQLGQEIVQVVQVGNALLVTSTYGEGPGATDPEALDADVREDAESLQPLVEAMCGLAPGAC